MKSAKKTDPSPRVRVYISGPISNGGTLDRAARLQNVALAADVAKRLIHLGYAPLCPHLTEFLDDGIPEISHEQWMEVDRPWVAMADVLLRLPGDSKGADMESQIAQDRNIPIANSIEELAAMCSPQQDKAEADLGELRRFSSGAVRSSDADGERYDLISPIGLRRLAQTCAEGATEYGDHNWLKGMPVSDLLNHALRHLRLFLAGDDNEDHLAHAAWNLFAAMHFEETRPDLMDLAFRSSPGQTDAK